MSARWPEDLQKFALESQIPIRLACTTESGWPVVLSLWYLFEDGTLYCATREGARVVAYLKEDSRCAFEIASDQMPYCGIRGQARAEILPDRGDEILERLLERYLGGLGNPLAEKLLNRSEGEVALAIRPVNLSSWNFEGRMTSIAPQISAERPCPKGSTRIDMLAGSDEQEGS